MKCRLSSQCSCIQEDEIQQEADSVDVMRLSEWIQSGASPQKVETALGVDYMSYAEAKKVYYKLLLRFHADKGGDHNVTVMLTQAWAVFSTKWSGERIDLCSEDEKVIEKPENTRQREREFEETIDLCSEFSEDTCSSNDF